MVGAAEPIPCIAWAQQLTVAGPRWVGSGEGGEERERDEHYARAQRVVQWRFAASQRVSVEGSQRISLEESWWIRLTSITRCSIPPCTHRTRRTRRTRSIIIIIIIIIIIVVVVVVVVVHRSIICRVTGHVVTHCI